MVKTQSSMPPAAEAAAAALVTSLGFLRDTRDDSCTAQPASTPDVCMLVICPLIRYKRADQHTQAFLLTETR